MKKIFITAAVLITLTVLYGCYAEYDVYRLHVIANSDSQADQAVKLDVRDNILKLIEKDNIKLETKENVSEYISQNMQKITQDANNTLKLNGFDYNAQTESGVFYFPERNYDGVIYPAGEYEGLKIVLGEGNGQNWWCVIFPPLCVINSSEKIKNAQEPKIVYKSAVFETINKIFNGEEK